MVMMSTQQQETISSMTTTAASPNLMAGTHPMFIRSISAPHIFLNGLQEDLFAQEYHYHAQPMQQFNTTFQASPLQYPAFVQTPHPFDPCPIPHMPPTQQYPMASSPHLSSDQSHAPFVSDTLAPPTLVDDSSSFPYTQVVHPFQMDQVASSINTLAEATNTRLKPEYQASNVHLANMVDESQGSMPSSASCSPTSTMLRGSEEPFSPNEAIGSPVRSPNRGQSLSFIRTTVPQLEFHEEYSEEYPPYPYPRHGSLDSIYPLAVFHEQFEVQGGSPGFEGGTVMQASSSSRSISSSSSTTTHVPPSRSRSRRASMSADNKMFPCISDDCGRTFKRSEHLKRHVRSVHTQEKLSATVTSTNHLIASIKKSLSVVQTENDRINDFHSEVNSSSSNYHHRHHDASSSTSSASANNGFETLNFGTSTAASLDVDDDDNHTRYNNPVNKATTITTPLQHEQYPSLQPWRGLDRRIKNFGLSMPVSANYTAPRHPIVLCHGLFGFDKIGPEGIPHLQIHYWSGIQKALTKLGAKVVVAGVPRTGAIKKRADDLHRMLSSTVEGMPVNFLAHSMGGLDCRYLISHIQDKNYNVQSLTTLSTPHRGSPFMDWCRDNIGVGLLQSHEQEAMRKLGK
ncbi:hypothetical protein BG004_008218, partial [Podila humilis]